MYEYARTEPVTVSLRALSGRVDVEAGPHETIQVDVTPLRDSSAARDLAAEVKVALEGDTLVVHVPDRRGALWRRGHSLAITIRVPEGSTLTGRSAAAGIRAAGRYAQVDLKLSSGDSEVENVDGEARITTASGHLTVGRAGGAVALKTSSGHLTIGDVTGDVTAGTSSGDIRLASAGASVEATSASGEIEVGRLRQGRARIRTSSGDVRVGVATGTGVWLDLNTSSGRNVNNLASPGDDIPSTGATLELKVRTASGDIHIQRAA
ncbi:DUF4097 family beta strand repeat-containing protein [Actinoplanes xinjiangensis]|uniref:DUF4097 and DUF4098 domain-containing protein YvlB n=1 Tax=Actinoplanes xinjiangensis TaxID=512350 RepID=A0A316FVM9_9ACTN|nr:DUF4097 family beta strand repeat-containing protein [Actinoplanes xinjiangensis]PWK52372.1 DUF4097 and DUF4098 domain-containing protein YvlB [Actinoplanes xinjiangensis]GIF36927.1 hypothetical protein Axi01nite_12380 [Actinoplanes xinjiangensis]